MSLKSKAYSVNGTGAEVPNGFESYNLKSMTQILSNLITQDLRMSWLRIEQAHALKDGGCALIWRQRQNDALDALLPVALFAETMQIELNATDLVDIDRLIGLVDLLLEKYPAGAALACSRVFRMMDCLPGYHSQAGTSQSPRCRQHHDFDLLGASSLRDAAKLRPRPT